MKIDYTDHGLDRIRERRITKKDVAEAIAKGKKDDTIDGLRTSSHKTKNKTLIVIYRIKDPQQVSVITAYWQYTTLLMEVKLDTTADALYIKLRKGTIAKTKDKGDHFADYDKEGHLLGFEVLQLSKKVPLSERKLVSVIDNRRIPLPA